jgi:hypothetical protein
MRNLLSNEEIFKIQGSQLRADEILLEILSRLQAPDCIGDSILLLDDDDLDKSDR